MRVYACLYIIYVYICVCMLYIRICVCVCVCVFVCNTCVYRCLYVYMRIYVFVRIHTHIRVCMQYMHIYVFVSLVEELTKNVRIQGTTLKNWLWPCNVSMSAVLNPLTHITVKHP